MNYSEEQEMFLLGVSSNFGQSSWGRGINSAVYDAIKAQLETWSLTDWEIVWGPAIFVPRIPSDPTKTPGPTNVMFAAYNEARSSYFISVAGTNSGALYDLAEDLKVHELVPWPYGSNSGNIASGSHTGLTILQKLKPVKGLQGEEQTLTDFLSLDLQGRKGNVSIITGGHSLGGALSPLVGLWLRDTQDEWDKDHIVAEDGFSCWRSAGPTPGDSTFAEYYNHRMTNTVSLINYLDVITKWWDSADTILGLYEPDIHPGSEITSIVMVMEKMVEGKDYRQIGNLDIRMESIVDPAYISSCEDDCSNFTKQMGYQHVRAYFTLLGLPIPFGLGVDQFSKICVSAPTHENAGNARRNLR